MFGENTAAGKLWLEKLVQYKIKIAGFKKADIINQGLGR